ncbi:site-specific integrase [Ruegeria sp. 6PALISEP08]|uniref:site-specific integrase n=1 Tax=Ruegeria sp. 6PALISEP08 TaxID=1225660 RepID=UPI00067ED633|nr:site-specific integrase [Ruegeria sp. 6PALISEP08]
MTLNAHLRLLADIRRASPSDPVPGRAELSEHLSQRQAETGATALSEFAYVQQMANAKWGRGRTAHFAQVLRQHRVSQKPPRRTAWGEAEALLQELPKHWHSPIAGQISLSKQGKRVLGQTLWSAAHTLNVIRALKRWAAYCSVHGCSMVPTGSSLDAFGRHLFADREDGQTVGARTVADYQSRILSGIGLVQPGFASTACNFVVADWRNRADQEGAVTKTGAQLVGATAIWDLGFRHIDNARSAPMRGLDAARQYRNGLILAIGTALPQRARALSCLSFGSSLSLRDDDTVGIRIPASMLKLPEERKQGAPYERSLHNRRLAQALQEYRQLFRPIFDDGCAVFPSIKSRNTGISEKQIGRLTGNMTEKAFGTRISIHRLRDNVATQASETMTATGRAAAALLGHKSQSTVARHYDHSEGIQAAEEFGALLSSYQGAGVDLDL